MIRKITKRIRKDQKNPRIWKILNRAKTATYARNAKTIERRIARIQSILI